MTDELLKMIPGAGEVSDWFGRWPSFHDAEISELQLHPSAVTFKLFAWNTISDVDEKGYYRREKQADIEFRLEEVSAINLRDLTDTGILFDLVIEPADTHLMIIMSSSYGVNGTITCERCSVTHKPR